MNWTSEIGKHALAEVKGNESQHGILKADPVKHALWRLIEQAATDGARMEFYTLGGWSHCCPNVFRDDIAYRVSPSWQPPKPKTLAEERKEFMDAAFRRGNVVRFVHRETAKYVSSFDKWNDNEDYLAAYMATHDGRHAATGWTWEEYTLTEMTPAEAIADYKARGGKVPEKAEEVERCEVAIADGVLSYHRKRTYTLAYAQNDPDFIAYEYKNGNGHSYSKNPRLCDNPEQGKPARVPVAVLFRKVTV